MTYPTPYQLLHLLSNNQWNKGPELARKLGISRAAIWKQVKQLQSTGLAIEHDHRGYRLSDMLVLLNEDTIIQGIDSKGLQKNVHLKVLPTIGSTNQYVKDHIKSDSWMLCLSEQQTAGRGRLGRTWVSPFGENMYLSIGWQTNDNLAKLSGLSIAASLSLQQALSPWVDNLQVKWPNDVVWMGRKLAGCLVEVRAENYGSCSVVVGMGLNINTRTNIHPLSDHPHCSMSDIANNYLNRNDIIITVINDCLNSLQQFEKYGLKPLMSSWKEADYLYNQLITVYQANTTLQGTAKGINNLGYLLLEKKDGSIEEISSGEASLRQ